MFSRYYRRIWFAGLLLGSLTIIWLVPVRLDDRISLKIGPQPDGTILVPTNQLLDPTGFQLYFPGRPVDLALSPDRSLLAVKNMEGICLVRLTNPTRGFARFVCRSHGSRDWVLTGRNQRP
jgi:hypothetical protein